MTLFSRAFRRSFTLPPDVYFGFAGSGASTDALALVRWNLPVANPDGSDQFQRLIDLCACDSGQFDALEKVAGLAVDHD